MLPLARLLVIFQIMTMEMSKRERGGDALPPYISMYQIPGQDPITPHSWERHRRPAQDNLIAKKAHSKIVSKIMSAPMSDRASLVEEIFTNQKSDLETQLSVLANMFLVPGNAHGSIVGLALACREPKVQLAAVSLIAEHVPMQKRSSLIQLALESVDLEVRLAAIPLIEIIPEQERAALISLCIGSNDVHVQRAAVHLLRSAPADARAMLLQLALTVPDPDVRMTAAHLVSLVPAPDRGSLERVAIEIIHSAFQNSDSGVQRAAIPLVHIVPNGERLVLVRQYLESPDPEVRLAATSLIKLVPMTDEYSSLRSAVIEGVRESFEDRNPKIRLTAAASIGYVPHEVQDSLQQSLQERIAQDINGPDSDVQESAVPMIEYVFVHQRPPLIALALKSQNQKAQLAAVSLIKYIQPQAKGSLIGQALASFDIAVQLAAVPLIGTASEDAQFLLVRQCLESGEQRVRRAAVALTRCVSPEERRVLFDLIKSKGLGSELIKPVLYRQELDDEKFVRKDFGKTGSETVLLGGELKGKTIIRTITAESFVAWQKAYESHDAWERAGFDYVPVEPVQSYRLNAEGFVDVASGVLDLSVQDWQERTGGELFAREMKDAKEKIKQGIKDLHIDYDHDREPEFSHFHDGNFCLRFFRDKDNAPDFTRVPRVYLIDFDRAALL